MRLRSGFRATVAAALVTAISMSGCTASAPRRVAAPGVTAPPAPASSGPDAPAPAVSGPAPPATTASTAPRVAATTPTTAPRSTPAAPGCASNLAGQLASTGSASQLITVDASSYGTTYATLTAWQRSGGCWTVAAGPWSARLGRNGLSDHHVEGDGTTPTGAYGIGSTMYGIAPDPGVRYGYHQLVCGDWWNEDPTSPQYNTFQHVACNGPALGGQSERLWLQTVAYQSFALIDYNTGPVVPGRGSGVFLHYDTGGTTAGCVSLPASALVTVLRWLQPSSSPLIVIGTDAEIRRF